MNKKEEEPQPMVTFEAFTKSLRRRGYIVKAAKDAYREIDSEEVSLREIEEGSMVFEDGGIFVNLPDGSRQQVFLYKRSYRIADYGKPRYHTCKCEVIDSFLKSDGSIPEYRKANTMPVRVIDRTDMNKDKEVNDLPHCRYCSHLEGGKYDRLTSNEFAEILRKAHENDEPQPQGDVKVDIFGYTEDWQEVSRNYREKMDYTCEECGVKVDLMDGEFMHVHHVSGNKIDNRESNLRCLCIKCHSEVDARHVKNFSRRSQQNLIREFLEKYGEQRRKNMDEQWKESIQADKDFPF